MKNFDKWNKQKKKIDSITKTRHFEEREVWFINIGLNIRTEQDGQGEYFLRPVLVFKKFGDESFLGIPLTKTKRTGDFYCSFEFKNIISTAILTQMRLFDSSRMFNENRYGKISKKDFKEISEKLKKLLFTEKNT